MAAIALSHVPVGVDLEPENDIVDIPFDILHPKEARALRQIPASERCRTFLQLWTAKEAFVKTLGSGFSIAPDHFALQVQCKHQLTSLAEHTAELAVHSQRMTFEDGEAIYLSAALEV